MFNTTFIKRSFKLFLGATALFINSETKSQSVPSLTVTEINIQLDNGKQLKAEAGKLLVNESHFTSSGNKILLNFVRLKTSSSNPLSTVFYLAGGPGGSGINALKTNQLNIFLSLQTRSDVIIIDQRGTGITEPVLTKSTPLNLPLDKTLEHPESMRKLVEILKASRNDAVDKGADLNYYNSKESAADLDDLRASLKLDKINLWGHSYGSHLALAYAKYYEKHIDKMILEGVNGLNQRYRDPLEINILFDRIDSLIQLEPKIRNKISSFPALVSTQLIALEKSPVEAKIRVNNREVTVAIGRMDLEAAVIRNVGSIGFIRELPQLFYQMSTGDYRRAGELVYNIKMAPIGTPMSYSMHLASGVSTEKIAKIETNIPKGILRNAINYPYVFEPVKAVFNITDLGDDFRMQSTLNVPTLMLSADLDGRTSLNEAADLKKHFSNIKQIIFQNVSHDFLTPQLIPKMTGFFWGSRMDDETIKAEDFDFYPLNSSEIIDQLYKLVTTQGANAYRSKVQELLVPTNINYLSNSTVLPIAFRLIREKKASEAIEILNINIELFGKGNGQTNSALGEAYELIGDPAKAIENYKKALEINPLLLIPLLKTLP